MGCSCKGSKNLTPEQLLAQQAEQEAARARARARLERRRQKAPADRAKLYAGRR